MEYTPNSFVQCYAERTWQNYQELLRLHEENKHREIPKAYEVTQLINSFFGILITPYEATKPYKDVKTPENTLKSYKNTLKKMEKADEVALFDIINLIEKIKLDRRYYNDYRFDNDNPDILPVLFIERIRNSLSHGGDTGVRFFPATVPADEDKIYNNISSVIFQDKYNCEQFIIELTVDELSDLLRLLYCIYSKYPIIEKHKAEKYKRKIDELRTKMQSV